MRLFSDLTRLVRYRELLLTLFVRDVKVRYRQTLLGALWAILQPLSMALVLSAVFSPFIASQATAHPYFLYVFAGVLPWNLMAASLSFGTQSVTGHANLLTKVAFPREVFPISATLVNLLDYVVGLVLMFILLCIYGEPIHWIVVLLPLVLAVELFLAWGLALALSAVNVFFRDVRFLLPLITLIWMFLTPVFYPASRLSPTMRSVVRWNPMCQIVEMHRAILIDGTSPSGHVLGLLAIGCLAAATVGYAFFKRCEGHFAEVV